MVGLDLTYFNYNVPINWSELRPIGQFCVGRQMSSTLVMMIWVVFFLSVLPKPTSWNLLLFFSVGVAESTSVLTCRPYMDCYLHLTQVAAPARPSAHSFRCVYKPLLQHRDTTRPKQESMRSGLLSVILSLAVTAYCVPLAPTVAEVTVQDERLAEVRTVSFILACMFPQHF